MKPRIIKLESPAGYCIGVVTFNYLINYGTGWAYTYTMTEEGFMRLCQATGWELTEESTKPPPITYPLTAGMNE